MHLFNDDVVSEYKEWEKSFPNVFSWWDFLNIKADMDIALGFAKFYCPEIIEIDGCCILKDKYDEEIFKSWKEDCKYNKKDVEKMVNIYELCDFFFMKETDNREEKAKVLGNVLKFFWTTMFEKMYPEKKLKVEVFEEYDELFITVYSERE